MLCAIVVATSIAGAVAPNIQPNIGFVDQEMQVIVLREHVNIKPDEYEMCDVSLSKCVKGLAVTPANPLTVFPLQDGWSDYTHVLLRGRADKSKVEFLELVDARRSADVFWFDKFFSTITLIAGFLLSQVQSRISIWREDKRNRQRALSQLLALEVQIDNGKPIDVALSNDCQPSFFFSIGLYDIGYQLNDLVRQINSSSSSGLEQDSQQLVERFKGIISGMR